MTNNEEALKLVQECLDDWPYAATRVVDIMTRIEKVKELLKEQEAKTPIVRENSYGWKFYYCPRCEKEFYQNRKQAFCDKCGQEIKWDV